MPRSVIGQVKDSAPLTVANLAKRVGVSSSTLRTWERRYGLGPSARTQGLHRRYSALDVARVELVVELVAKGVPTCDAAERALKLVAGEAHPRCHTDVNVTSLVSACQSIDANLVQLILDQSIAQDGLLRTWNDLILPALEELKNVTGVETPGQFALLFLRSQVLVALAEMRRDYENGHDLRGIQEITKETAQETTKKATKNCVAAKTCATATQLESQHQPQVLLLGDYEHLLDAHVLGIALMWHGVDAKILAANSTHIAQACDGYVAEHQPQVVAFLGASICHQELVDRLAHDDQTEVVLIGDNVPCVLAPHVQRLRTLIAASEEIICMLNGH